MPAAIQPSVEPLAELRHPGISLQIIRSFRHDSDHLIESSNAYLLMLCVTPRPLNARACYPALWGGRFEPLGDLSLVPPGNAVLIRAERQRQISFSCHIARRLVAQWIGNEPEWSDPRLEAALHLSNPHLRALLMRLAEEAHRPGLASERLATLVAEQMAVEIARVYDSISDIRARGGLAPWRLRLIDERLRDLRKIPTAQEISVICGLSLRQLSRAFKASRGISIRDYLVAARIERAKQLLAGDATIQSIAHASGFSCASTFAHSFRMATGSSPREFRHRMGRAMQDAISPSAILPD